MKSEHKNSRRREPAPGSAAQMLWLTTALAVATLPHLPHVALWIPFLIVGLSAWRLQAARRRWALPSIWIRMPMAIAGFAAVYATYRQVTGVDAGSALLMVMAGLKLLETRGRRDRAVVVFLCFFLLFAAFLREQALWGPAYLFSGALFVVMALLQVTRRNDAIAPGQALSIASRLLAQAAPLALVLFILFPRVPGPFWSLPQRGGSAMTGLSDSMSPGDITELALSDEVAFRVRFDGETPAASDLYWRGPVLSDFDGRKWKMRGVSFLPGLQEKVDRNGDTVSYEITLEPHGQRWLLALETPLSWQAPKAITTAPYQLMRFRPIENRTSYRATSALTGTTPGLMSGPARVADTGLPPDRNPRSVEWAKTQRAESESDAAFLREILNLFSDQPFFYSLKPAALGPQSVDDFLFNTREGFCGHYASAFTVLARAAGIPARVVTGYQGGELNPLADYMIVRQADAHAWAEVWLDGRWVRYDPTGAVAPERVLWGIDQAIESGSLSGADERRRGLFGVGLYMSWDALNALWNRWVLGFGPESQSELLRWGGISEPTVRHLVVGLAAGMSLCLALLGAWHYRRGRPRLDALARAYNVLCARTARAARPRRPAEGPEEYAAAVADLRPELRSDVENLFAAYARLRYDGPAGREGIARFADAVSRFRPARRPAGQPA
jgi:transglutaminase-like putative cysteine protease